MRISDWSSDVCSSDLKRLRRVAQSKKPKQRRRAKCWRTWNNATLWSRRGGRRAQCGKNHAGECDGRAESRHRPTKGYEITQDFADRRTVMRGKNGDEQVVYWWCTNIQ